jgi:hypothetical protein
MSSALAEIPGRPGINWMVKQRSSMWPLQHGGLREVRFITWILREFRKSVTCDPEESCKSSDLALEYHSATFS